MGQSIPIRGNSQIEVAANRVFFWMLEKDYAPGAALRAERVIRRTGCVADAVARDMLLAIDERHAEAVFVDALPAVPYEDPAWGPRALPSQAIPDRTEDVPEGLPPVCGGAPDHDEADWADYAAWSDALERERDREEALEEMHRADVMASLRRAEDRAPLWGYE